jgi:hypothetical protein
MRDSSLFAAKSDPPHKGEVDVVDAFLTTGTIKRAVAEAAFYHVERELVRSVLHKKAATGRYYYRPFPVDIDSDDTPLNRFLNISEREAPDVDSAFQYGLVKWGDSHAEIRKVLARRIYASAAEHAFATAAENKALRDQIAFMETQLRREAFGFQLYKIGAAGFFASVMSLVFWAVTGVGAPFHPVFAGLLTPASAGIMAMGFLVRRSEKQRKAEIGISSVAAAQGT